MVKNKQVPTGVKIISVLYYIGAALLLIGAIVALLGGTFLSGVFGGLVALGIGIFLAIIFLAFAVLSFFIAKGLWKAKNWARVVVIILSCLGFLGAISSLLSGQMTGIISLILNGVVGWYLWFSKEAKGFFR